jgi:hypothetical protein
MPAPIQSGATYHVLNALGGSGMRRTGCPQLADGRTRPDVERR